MKHFSVAQAEAMIPELERVFAAILEIRPKAQQKALSVQKLEDAGGDPAALALEKGQLEFLISGINECFQRILDAGAEPKGLDPALVDFPHRLGGREVHLCWKLGEKKITHYHGLQEGFAGRKPLP